MTKDEQIELIRQALLEPPPIDQVRWRVRTKLGNDKAFVLAYIDARHVMERLDSVFGVFGWSRTHRIDGGNHICTIKVHCPVGSEEDDENSEWWCNLEKTVEDIAEPTDIEAAKGGASDAFKRASVNLGIARCLYALGNTKAALDSHGNILDSEITRLREEVLKPAFKRFRVENLLPSAKDDSKKSDASTEGAVEVLDPDILATSLRAKYYSRMLELAGTTCGGLLDGIVKKHGKWNTLDIIGKMSYIITLKAHVDALEQQVEKDKE